MSYPHPIYLGAAGEVSASLRSTHVPSDLVYPNGTTVDYLATGASTDAMFGLYRWTMPPGAGGPSLHFHRTMSESFFVLSGSVALADGERKVRASSGDFLHVPPGGLHGFSNAEGDAAVSMLILFSPGAPREGYFEGLLEMARGKTLSAEDRAAFFSAHDNLFAD